MFEVITKDILFCPDKSSDSSSSDYIRERLEVVELLFAGAQLEDDQPELLSSEIAVNVFQELGAVALKCSLVICAQEKFPSDNILMTMKKVLTGKALQSLKPLYSKKCLKFLSFMWEQSLWAYTVSGRHDYISRNKGIIFTDDCPSCPGLFPKIVQVIVNHFVNFMRHKLDMIPSTAPIEFLFKRREMSNELFAEFTRTDFSDIPMCLFTTQVDEYFRGWLDQQSVSRLIHSSAGKSRVESAAREIAEDPAVLELCVYPVHSAAIGDTDGFFSRGDTGIPLEDCSGLLEANCVSFLVMPLSYESLISSHDHVPTIALIAQQSNVTARFCVYTEDAVPRTVEETSIWKAVQPKSLADAGIRLPGSRAPSNPLDTKHLYRFVKTATEDSTAPTRLSVAAPVFQPEATAVLYPWVVGRGAPLTFHNATKVFHEFLQAVLRSAFDPNVFFLTEGEGSQKQVTVIQFPSPNGMVYVPASEITTFFESKPLTVIAQRDADLGNRFRALSTLEKSKCGACYVACVRLHELQLLDPATHAYCGDALTTHKILTAYLEFSGAVPSLPTAARPYDFSHLTAALKTEEVVLWKSRLQEWFQKSVRTDLAPNHCIHYDTVAVGQQDHFCSTVTVRMPTGDYTATGETCRGKKAAEHAAAKRAYQVLVDRGAPDDLSDIDVSSVFSASSAMEGPWEAAQRTTKDPFPSDISAVTDFTRLKPPAAPSSAFLFQSSTPVGVSDPKSSLQQLLQKRFPNVPIHMMVQYETVPTTTVGEFRSTLHIRMPDKDPIVTRGSALGKKGAEKIAAEEALAVIKLQSAFL